MKEKSLYFPEWIVWLFCQYRLGHSRCSDLRHDVLDRNDAHLARHSRYCADHRNSGGF